MSLLIQISVCFEKFLELFASEQPEDLHIIQVDKVGFHNSLNLTLPENVILLFQPAYSPEVNPIERLWGYVKEQLKWLRFDLIEELRAAVQKELKKLTKEIVARFRDGNSFQMPYLQQDFKKLVEVNPDAATSLLIKLRFG